MQLNFPSLMGASSKKVVVDDHWPQIAWPHRLCPRMTAKMWCEGDPFPAEDFRMLQLQESRENSALYATDKRLLPLEEWFRSHLYQFRAEGLPKRDDQFVRIPVDEWSYDLLPDWWDANSLAILVLTNFMPKHLTEDGRRLAGEADFRRVDLAFERGVDSFDLEAAPWMPPDDIVDLLLRKDT